MGLYRRGSVWWMRFTYKGQQARKSTETINRKLAEKIYCKVVSQIAEGKWFDVDEADQRDFGELAEKYETQVFRELKSYQKNRCYLNQLRDFFGKYRLSNITPALIDDFKQMRKEQGVTSTTINKQLSMLRRMFNLAKKRWMWIKEIPLIEVEPNADNKRTRHLSFKEFYRLLEFCDLWLKDIVIVAAWTGLRRENVVMLRKMQVDLIKKEITVDGAEIKNGEKLRIPIAGPAYEVLAGLMSNDKTNSLYVFRNEEGKPYNPKKVYRLFKKSLECAGIEDFRFHDLRHCFASWNRQAGVDIYTLAELMGHKDTKMTMRYAHITPAHLTKAIGLLEKSYHNSSTKLAHPNKDVVSLSA
ncbi:MAG: tyrosine-type recombinase/integrase [Candidatus Scalindua rubra]|nr:tyrosine-type recombinase/integrase [Candidatus Scalindua rubra]TWU31433.1 Tyrosine recombinase XerD [Candidatus Brocadiaceae bacterium S225]